MYYYYNSVFVFDIDGCGRLSRQERFFLRDARIRRCRTRTRSGYSAAGTVCRRPTMSGRSTLVARRSTGCAGSRSPSWAVRGPPRAVISNHTVFTPNLVQNVVIVIGASASRTYGVSTSVRGSPELFSRRSPSLIPLPSQTRQFGHKSNQTRCTGVYRIHRHKWDPTFSFLPVVGTTARSTPRNCSSSTLVSFFSTFPGPRSSVLPHAGVPLFLNSVIAI